MASFSPEFTNSGAGAMPSDPEGGGFAERGDTNEGRQSGVAEQQPSKRSIALPPLPALSAAAKHVATRLLSPSAHAPTPTPSNRVVHALMAGPGASMTSPLHALQPKKAFTLFSDAHKNDGGDAPDAADAEVAGEQGETRSSMGMQQPAGSLHQNFQVLATGVKSLVSAAEQQLVKRRGGERLMSAFAGTARSALGSPLFDDESGSGKAKKAFAPSLSSSLHPLLKKLKKAAKDFQVGFGSTLRRHKLERGIPLLLAVVVVLGLFFGRSFPSPAKPAEIANNEPSVLVEAPAGVAAVPSREIPVSSDHGAVATAAAAAAPALPLSPAPHDHRCHTDRPVLNAKSKKQYVYCTSEAMTWPEANESARAAGGILAEVRSAEERNFILREILWPCLDDGVVLDVTESNSFVDGSSAHPHQHGHSAVIKRRIGPMIGAHSVDVALYEKTKASIATANGEDYKTEQERQPTMKIAGGGHEHDHLSQQELYPFGTFLWAASGIPVPLPHEGHLGGSWPVDPVNPHGVRLHGVAKKDEHQMAHTLAFGITDTEGHTHIGAEEELELAWMSLPIIDDAARATPGHGKYFFLVESQGPEGSLDLTRVCKKASSTVPQGLSNGGFLSPSNPGSAGSSGHHSLLSTSLEKVADVIEGSAKGLRKAAKKMGGSAA